MDLNPSKLTQFKIVSALDQQMVIDCVMDQNNFLVLWKWHQGNNQRWNIQDLGNGKFTFYNVMNSRVISAPIDIHKEGWFIKCSFSKKTQNQIWEMIPCMDEKFKEQNAFWIKNPKSGKVLDIYQAKAKNGQSIIQWEMKKDQKIKFKLNQIWLIEPVSFIPEKKSLYKIFSAVDFNLVLDASKGDSNLNNLILYNCHKGNNQKFSIETSKGKYRLINKDKNLSVTVEKEQKGSKVKVIESNREANQLWQLIPCKIKQLQGKKSYYIKSTYGMYLDVINGKVFNGSEIVQTQFTGNQSQIWFIHKI